MIRKIQAIMISNIAVPTDVTEVEKEHFMNLWQIQR